MRGWNGRAFQFGRKAYPESEPSASGSDSERKKEPADMEPSPQGGCEMESASSDAIGGSNPCEACRCAACFATIRSAALRSKNASRFGSGIRIRVTAYEKKTAPLKWSCLFLARRKGFEPLTFWSVARHSIQLWACFAIPWGYYSKRLNPLQSQGFQRFALYHCVPM